MAAINPYLLFNGNCEEVFLFYKSVFGGEFSYVGKYSEIPADAAGGEAISEEDKNRIMHISLPIGKDSVLMGGDSNSASGPVSFGSNFSISINTESKQEADKLFDGLSAGGNPFMPMSQTFWGAYFGMFTDKYGIQWLINYEYE